MEEKIFLIINLSYLGDVLLSNSLCLNIKKNYPNSKIIYIVNKPFYEAALYQNCVDEVFSFDKRNENKGILGLLKFWLKFPYKGKIFAAFSIYANDRAVLLSFLLNCKNRISGPRGINKLLLTHIHCNNPVYNHMQELNADLLQSLTGKEIEILPIKYDTERVNDTYTKEIMETYKDKEVIGLCTLTKNEKKDMPVEQAAEIIKRLNADGKTVFYFGQGENSIKYAEELKKSGCINFVDFTNKTTISQLAVLLKFCKGVITVDTGTMHLACAVATPLVSIFYLKDYIQKWAPRTALYKCAVISDDYSVENIVQNLYSLLN